MNCKYCNNETANPSFCNKSCVAKYNNRLYPKRKITRICKLCTNPVKSYRHLLCSIHWEKYKSSKSIQNSNITIGSYRQKLSVNGKHPSWTHSHIRQFARSWNKEMCLQPCFNCGYSIHVELCHKKAVSEFDDDTPLSIVNHSNNLIPLCRNCHWEFDNGYLKI